MRLDNKTLIKGTIFCLEMSDSDLSVINLDN